MVTQNEIQKGDLPSQYFVEQNNEESLRKQKDEEVFKTYDCIGESMSNTEFSLNPPPE